MMVPILQMRKLRYRGNGRHAQDHTTSKGQRSGSKLWLPVLVLGRTGLEPSDRGEIGGSEMEEEFSSEYLRRKKQQATKEEYELWILGFFHDLGFLGKSHISSWSTCPCVKDQSHSGESQGAFDDSRRCWLAWQMQVVLTDALRLSHRVR